MVAITRNPITSTLETRIKMIEVGMLLTHFLSYDIFLVILRVWMRGNKFRKVLAYEGVA